MKKHLDVVAGLIKDKDKFFICQRSEGMTLPEMWEFPGGKIEKNETPEQALIREISEELDCDIIVGNHIDTSDFDYGNFSITISVYICTLINNTIPTINEHMDSAWIRVEQFDNYIFPPADLNALNKIKEIYGK